MGRALLPALVLIIGKPPIACRALPSPACRSKPTPRPTSPWRRSACSTLRSGQRQSDRAAVQPCTAAAAQLASCQLRRQHAGMHWSTCLQGQAGQAAVKLAVEAACQGWSGVRSSRQQSVGPSCTLLGVEGGVRVSYRKENQLRGLALASDLQGQEKSVGWAEGRRTSCADAPPYCGGCFLLVGQSLVKTRDDAKLPAGREQAWAVASRTSLHRMRDQHAKQRALGCQA